MTKSLILSILEEADELALPSLPEDSGQPDAIDPATVAAPPTPDPAAVSAGQANPQFPSPATPTATVQKLVLNKELILAIFSELKSLVTNYEKKLGTEEIPIEDAKIYIQSLLSSLAFNAQKLNDLMNSTAPSSPGVSMPAAAVTPPAPTGDLGPDAAFAKAPETTNDPFAALEL